MKTFILAALAVATNAVTLEDAPLSFFNFDNAKMIWNKDWEGYRDARSDDNNCRLPESDNWYGAQQCKFSWECRGARICERGGWCSGYDGCDGTPLPMQSPGLAPDC